MNLKRVSLETLAAYLQAQLGDVAQVFVGPADHEDQEPTPSVRVVPQSFILMPFQDLPVDETIANVVLSELGYWEGVTEIRIVANLQTVRERIEDAVLQIMLGDSELAPGVVVLKTPPLAVGPLQTAYAAPFSWTLNDQDWREEMSFDDHRYSFIELDTTVPALAVRSEVYTINDLRFELESSTKADTTGATPVDPNSTATFAVDAAGNLSPAA